MAGCGGFDFENQKYTDKELIENPKDTKKLILKCQEKTNGELKANENLKHNCETVLVLALFGGLPKELYDDKELKKFFNKK